MLGMGMSEMALIMVVAILVVPPEQLPKVMRQLGRWYSQIRHAADDLRRAFTLEADRQDAAERYRALQERRRKAHEQRKKDEAASGGIAQPEAVSAPPPEATVATDDDGAPTPNDIPPDAPAPVAPRPLAEERE